MIMGTVCFPTGDITAYFPAGTGAPGSRHASSHSKENTPLISLCAAGAAIEYPHAARHITVAPIHLALSLITSFLFNLHIVHATAQQPPYCRDVLGIMRTVLLTERKVVFMQTRCGLTKTTSGGLRCRGGSKHWNVGGRVFPEVGRVKAGGFQALEKNAAKVPGPENTTIILTGAGRGW
ncbi:MAG: hypothetical protein NTY53_25235 [Kiritimatiellaeota bacterium]|nr:hypothetical protein [Kiritimatiellota bacterium]